MGLEGAMYQQTGAILPGCNAEASQQGFFNSASTNSMVMIGEYQKMMEGEGLTTAYNDTDSMQGTFNTNAEMQVTFRTYVHHNDAKLKHRSSNNYIN